MLRSFFLGSLLAAPLAAQAPRVTTSPAKPVRGRLLTVSVRLPDSARVEGSLAGERLHFRRVAERAGAAGKRTTKGVVRFDAIGAVPIEAPDTLPLVVSVSGDSLVVPVVVVAGNYRTEQLRVAPEFGREPDSALARRIAEEGEKARMAGVRAHETPRLWRAPFVLPRPGRVTSGFGTARTFNGAVQTRHMGVDMAGAVGAPIRAANRGVVVLVVDFYLAGHAVYVDHGEGLVTGYFHMSRSNVAVGDTVARGQVIGRVGQSGRVTGPHLHWVMRYGGITVDPRSVFGLAPRTSQPARPAASPARSAAPRRPRAG